jgi:hypothetical protein
MAYTMIQHSPAMEQEFGRLLSLYKIPLNPTSMIILIEELHRPEL